MEVFLFRSSSSSHSLNKLGNSSTPTDSKIYWDKPWQSEGDFDNEYLYRSRIRRNSIHRSGSSVRRPLSFSSISTFDVDNGEGGGERGGGGEPSSVAVEFRKPKKKIISVGRRSKILAGDYDSDATTTNDGSYVDASELYKDESSDGGEEIYSSNYSGFSDVYPNKEEREDDEELRLKLKEAEQRLNLISEFDVVESDKTSATLLQLIKDINEDRMKMALEALNQVKDRISERSCAREVLKKVKLDFAARLKSQVDERNRLESSLNHQIDLRSNEQSSKLVKLEAEELRLRERVRKFAEHNVCLQKEVSSITGREEETHMRITNLGVHLNGLTAHLEEMKAENQNLQKTLSEVKKRSDSVEMDRDRMARMCRENDKEKKELQETLVKFQVICGDHEKTIAGLRQACRDADVSNRDDLLGRLRVEHIRLSGVEQTLRKEVESYRHRAKILGQENISLVHRLQETGGGSGRSWFNLEQELRSQMELLQSKGLEIMVANNNVCVELLDIVKARQESNGIDMEFDGFYVIEYIAKCQSLKRGIEKFRTSLQTLSTVLNEKSNIEDEGKKGSRSNTHYNHSTQINIELELKAESLVTKILREKLCSKELELEQLQEDFASSITGHEKIKVEIKHLQNQLRNLQHRCNDMEVQISRKDTDLNETKGELEERRRELTLNRDSLVKISKDRDLLWEESNKLKETNMVLSCEINSLKKKIESLEEDVLTKDGQISILRDSVISKFKQHRI